MSATDRSARDLDLILLGATGFVGQLTARHLAAHAPADLKWALAGRDPVRLEEQRTALASTVCPPQEVVVVDATDAIAMDAVADRTRLMITTVGPYLRHGEAAVAACAKAGTDYLDLTGEAEFVDHTWLAHHETAKASGARLVHACGFDSIPHDLGAQFTVEQLPTGVPIELRGVVRSAATFSGGTFHSALESMPRVKKAQETARRRRAREPRPAHRSSRAVSARPHRDPDLGYWLLPLPTLDPMVVARSGAALEEYGPKFTYSHYAGTKTLRFAAAGIVGITAVATAAQFGPLRRMMAARVPAGTGPDEAKRARSWFTVDFIGKAGGEVVHTRVSGGDPGYGETAMMLAQSALCLLEDDNPPTAGQVTTAVAMGPRLRERLVRQGMRFEIISQTGTDA